uniref:Uncharacterized protein n=1 Tax=Prymnesium polylepis TaxID=72548 RepID=A0A7S4MZI5_9EUKA
MAAIDVGDALQCAARYETDCRAREQAVTSNIARLLTPKINTRALAEQPTPRESYQAMHNSPRYRIEEPFNVSPRRPATTSSLFGCSMPNPPDLVTGHAVLPRRLRNGYFA